MENNDSQIGEQRIIYPPYQGEFVPVNPKGTYTVWTPSILDRGATNPTFVNSILGHPIKEGLYIGLEIVGYFRYGEDRPNHPFPPTQRMSASFLSRQGNFHIPALEGGDQQETTNPPTVGAGPGEIVGDFEIPFGRRLIIRVPNYTSGIRFSVPDSYYSDNSVVGRFGVYLSWPNGQAWVDTTDGPMPSRWDRFAPTPFSGHGGTHPNWSQWRGWYKASGWRPELSKFGADEGRSHRGIDLFCPTNTILVAPVDSVFTWEHLTSPSGQELGSIAAFRFQESGSEHMIFYAHCDRALVGNSQVAKGTPVATSGCSGNSADQGCGLDRDDGGRVDHVHVGWSKDGEFHPQFYGDPIKLMNWSVA